MVYAIWVMILLALLVWIPAANPDQFVGLPLLMVAGLAVVALYCGIRGRGPGRRDRLFFS